MIYWLPSQIGEETLQVSGKSNARPVVIRGFISWVPPSLCRIRKHELRNLIVKFITDSPKVSRRTALHDKEDTLRSWKWLSKRWKSTYFILTGVSRFHFRVRFCLLQQFLYSCVFIYYKKKSIGVEKKVLTGKISFSY